MADRYLELLLGDQKVIRLITRQHGTVLAGEMLSESALAGYQDWVTTTGR